MKKNILAFSAACCGMFLFGITLITLGTIATDLKTKFNLDGMASGTLFSMLPFGILTGSLLFGPICDRYGYKLLMMLACVGMFTGFEGIAFANNMPMLKLSIFIFGLSGGIINGSTNVVVADISEKYKGANLSILGIFFGLGALGMPLVIGLLEESFEPFAVVAVVGILALVVGILYSFVKFPPAKRNKDTPQGSWKSLVTLLLLLISMFLFFQSSFEALINNWATTYLMDRGLMTEKTALYGLSLHIAGMVVMRLITGSILRTVSGITMLWTSLGMLAIGIALMQASESTAVIMMGLIFSGAGLAGGFPLMLGFVGERFTNFSGTAFSFVFTIALIGNMLVNYLMGIITDAYGIRHLATVSYVEIAFMAILFYFIIQQLKTTK